MQMRYQKGGVYANEMQMDTRSSELPNKVEEKRIWPKESCRLLSAIQMSMSSSDAGRTWECLVMAQHLRH